MMIPRDKYLGERVRDLDDAGHFVTVSRLRRLDRLP